MLLLAKRHIASVALAFAWLQDVTAGASASTRPAAARDLCPITCMESGFDRSEWTVVAKLDQLRSCQRPLVVDIPLQGNVTDIQQIRSCNVWAADFDVPEPEGNAAATMPDSVIREVEAHLAWTPAAGEDETGGIIAEQSVVHLQSYLTNAKGVANRTMLFATVSDTTVGVYVGARLANPSVAEHLINPLLDLLWSDGVARSKTALVQACTNQTSEDIFGLIVADSLSFATVHAAVKQWSDGNCVDTTTAFAKRMELSASIVTASNAPRNPTTQSESAFSTKDMTVNDTLKEASSVARGVDLSRRGTCRTEKVQSGDSCAALVERCGGGLKASQFTAYNPEKNLCSSLSIGQRVCCSEGDLPVANSRPKSDGTCRTQKVEGGDTCGTLVLRCDNDITADQFYKFNKGKELCSSLRVGQHVCCTEGEMPDLTPKPNADGTCHAYQIKENDSCSVIAAANGLIVSDIEKFNRDTWGFNGCNNGFWPHNWICLSTGISPFPAAISNAVCGPQKPGTQKPVGSTSRDWYKLNLCPLNSCCNIWGQCGVTEDFCIDTNVGPPGTAKKGTYGCISNCGMDVVIGSPPTEFKRLGYFEGFNLGRQCLNMDVTQVDASKYTHIHFAFGMIDAQYNVYQADSLAKYQFQQFKKLKGPKKIISFGGWVFSAEAPNYNILRQGVKGENRARLADNLVRYVVENGLDGLDIDWEYPAAPDLPGIPAGEEREALDYLRFLTILRENLPQDKSLSIAAPASYWYLKQFPIKAMSDILDYIVFMSYDLHGQWDAGNKWSSPGCPSGKCLRSHINVTETMSALTMITKAGVPSNKILVGVSSYGRSFQMQDPSCTGPDCLFTGDRLNSNARKGRCTETAGYLSNAEIAEINGRTWVDDTDTRIMVDGDLWVAYMDEEIKTRRTEKYRSLNMGGTTDWAVDLIQFHDPPLFESGGKFYEYSWTQTKSKAKERLDKPDDPAGCDRAKRTGEWITFDCTSYAIEYPTSYLAKDRWDSLDAQYAWDDAVRYFKTCIDVKRTPFPMAISEFLHIKEDTKCNDVSVETNCGGSTKCQVAQSRPEVYTGAAATLVWNSIASLHRLIKNYYTVIGDAGQNLQKDQQLFLKTFAPKQKNEDEVIDLIFSLLQIPYGAAAKRFFGGSFWKRIIDKGKIGDNAKSNIEDATKALIGLGWDAAKKQMKSQSDSERTISFNKVYDSIIKKWQEQTDHLAATIFNGEDDSIKVLTRLFEGGKMISGSDTQSVVASSREHTQHFRDERAIERAFYAQAIPAVWTLNAPVPVVVDFGPSCKIDARKYFSEKPSKYNVGWECPNGHSYILSGVREHRDKSQCNELDPRCQVLKDSKEPLSILDGISELKAPSEQWGFVSTNDLIIGCVFRLAFRFIIPRLNPPVPPTCLDLD
ncbi:hypothetical protein LLEC1_06736 [Akanthomyces lecanii]|uniref:chitinase n=1 Tax=Cordyceps confragosa TaxID=2714763 RepID=A0A179IT60_CORDF|nr:hypothetical protein LLEC1_06736 [Akanthomyces lecanii]